MENKIKFITTIVAILGLFFGVYKFIQVQKIDAAKPYLQKKLSWCIEAVETASYIANSASSTTSKEQRFWELYWGVMGMVENKEITEAMVKFGEALDSKNNLKSLSLNIAHACRNEMANDWSSTWKR